MGKNVLPSFTSKAGMAILQPLHSTDLLSPYMWTFPLSSAELLMIYTLTWEMGHRTSSWQPERGDGCLTGRTGEQRLRWFTQGRTQLRVGRRDDMALWGKSIIYEWWQRCATLLFSFVLRTYFLNIPEYSMEAFWDGVNREALTWYWQT